MPKKSPFHSIPIERHPLKPFLPNNAKMLFLGSFPPPKKRWCMDFYYPNFINDHWRIEGLVFFGDKNHFVNTEQKTFRKEAIIEFLQTKGIALYDSASAVQRLKENASDAFLQVVEKTDLPQLLNAIPLCHNIVCTGQLSARTLCDDYGAETPQMGQHSTFRIGEREMRLWRMPSSSRAYPMKLEEKAAYYKEMMRAIGLLDA